MKEDIEELEKLNKLLGLIKRETRNNYLPDEELERLSFPTREELDLSEYEYGITLIPENWVLPFLLKYKEILEGKIELEEDE